MAIHASPLIIDVSDPEKNGSVANFQSIQPAAAGLEIKADVTSRSIFLVTPSTTEGRVWDSVVEDPAKFRLGMGAGDIPPTGGTFSLSFDADTVDNLAFDISGPALSALIQTMTGGCEVTKISTGNYKIEFVSNGAQPLFSGLPRGLSPESNVFASRIQVGDDDQPEVQLIQCVQRPYVYCDDWQATTTTSGGVTYAGVTGKLRFNSAALVAKFASVTGASFATTLQVRLDNGTDDRQTVLYVPVQIFREVLSVASLSPSTWPGGYLSEAQAILDFAPIGLVADSKALTAKAHAADIASKSLYFAGEVGIHPFGPILPPGTGDFTCAAWVYIEEFVSGRPAVIFGNVGYGPAASLTIRSDGLLQMHYISLGTQPYSTVAISETTKKWMHVGYARTAGVGKFYLNGIQLGDAVTDTQNLTVNLDMVGGSYAAWADGLLSGYLAFPQHYNYGKTGSEMLSLFNRGGILKVTDRGGSMTAYPLGNFTLYSEYGATGASISSASGTGFIYNASAVANGNNAGAYAGNVPVSRNRKYRVRFTLTKNSGTVSACYFHLRVPGGGWDSIGGSTAVNLTSSSATYETIITADSTAAPRNSNLVIIFPDGTFNVTVSSLSIIPVGALVAIDDASKHCGFQVADISGNNKHLNLPASGVSIVSPSRRGQIIYTLAASYPVRVSYIPPYSYIDSIFLSGGADDPVIFVGTAALDIDNIAEGVTLSDFTYVETFTGRLAHSGEIWAMNDTNDDPVTIVINFTQNV